MKKLKAFTLVELLVVISIIGILASVVVINLSAFRQKGRDARRKSDLTQVSAALQLYYADNHSYPSPTGSGDSAQFDSISGSLVAGKYLTTGVANPYPTGYDSNNYNYKYISASDYKLYFQPENSTNASCQSPNCSTPFYIIYNGQESNQTL